MPSIDLVHDGIVTNIGFCLFLFLVRLEVDAEVIKRNARLSTTVAVAGMILPFWNRSGHGVCGVQGIYQPHSITTFPILYQLKILGTTVGIVVLSAGVGNVIGLFSSNFWNIPIFLTIHQLDGSCSLSV